MPQFSSSPVCVSRRETFRNTWSSCSLISGRTVPARRLYPQAEVEIVLIADGRQRRERGAAADRGRQVGGADLVQQLLLPLVQRGGFRAKKPSNRSPGPQIW